MIIYILFYKNKRLSLSVLVGYPQSEKHKTGIQKYIRTRVQCFVYSQCGLWDVPKISFVYTCAGRLTIWSSNETLTL